MTLTQAILAVQQNPGPYILGVGGVVVTVLAYVSKRVIGAFDKLGFRVEAFQTILASHEREDGTRFAGIEDRASTRHEAVIAEVRRHADVVTGVTGPLQIEMERAVLRIEALEGIVERRQKPHTPKVD